MKNLDDLAERLLDIICELDGSDLRQEQRIIEIRVVVRKAFPHHSSNFINKFSNELYSALFGDLYEDKKI
jgi:hypothetical protein